MYSIGNVIYGVPITDKLKHHIRSWGLEDNQEFLEELGFETLYHGGGSGIVGYFGMEVTEFDECMLNLRLSTLTKEADKVIRNEAQLKKIQNRINQLDQKIKEYFELQDLDYDETEHKIQHLLEETDIYIVFSTS